MDKKTELLDLNGNKIVVPEGFKILSDDTTNNATTVDKGIVIQDETINEDGTPTATNGSQFVWIPAPNDGRIYTNAEMTQFKEVKLNRYTFAEDGTPIAQNESAIPKEDDVNYNFQETLANINQFKTSVYTNGGFYIGRYEARTIEERTSKTDPEKQITVKKSDSVYNYVTQEQALRIANSMYNTRVKSELIK